MIERCEQERRSTFRWVCVFACLSLSFAGELCARELHVLSTEPGLPVTLVGAQSARGLSPFSLPNGTDFTQLQTGGRGFEWRRAELAWSEGGQPFIVNDHRRRALLGMLLPGGGSILSGRRLYGFTEFIGTGYLMTELLRASDDRKARADDYSHWKRLYDEAADQDARRLYRWESELSFALWEEDRSHQIREARIVGTYLGLVALESWWFNRPLSGQVRGAQLRLQVPRLSRGRAVLASLALPGMGQAYRGQSRAGFYLGLWTFLGQELHDNYHRKTLKAIRYQHRTAQYAAEGFDAGEEAELKRLREAVQSAEQDLHLFTVLAGGVWLANVMDVFFSRPEGARPAGKSAGLALTPSPAGAVGLAWTARF